LPKALPDDFESTPGMELNDDIDVVWCWK